tara:strand:- start:94 stop:279 length:186 start_codon:yes stop_codon:yes gene_type:complete
MVPIESIYKLIMATGGLVLLGLIIVWFYKGIKLLRICLVLAKRAEDITDIRWILQFIKSLK